MKQTDLCARCGHTLMLHSGGVCRSCSRCANFVSRLKVKGETKRLILNSAESATDRAFERIESTKLKDSEK